jgi:hypothetical protein
MMRAACLLTFAACGGAAAAVPCVTVPAAIDAGPVAPVLVVHAKGVQSYACKDGAWTLVAPKADLFDDAGTVIGHHGAGPVWDLIDGSHVAGTKLAAATVDANAIPWLLLDASGGTGRLASVTRVQRVHTTGGAAPASCAPTDPPTLDVPYTADYVFSAPAREPRCGRDK